MIRSLSPDTIFGNLSGDFVRREEERGLLHPIPRRATLPAINSLHLLRQQAYLQFHRINFQNEVASSNSTKSPSDSLKYSLSLTRFSAPKANSGENWERVDYSPGLTEDYVEDLDQETSRSLLMSVFDQYRKRGSSEASNRQNVQQTDLQQSTSQLVTLADLMLDDGSSESMLSLKIPDDSCRKLLFAKAQSGEKTFDTRIREEKRNGSLYREEALLHSHLEEYEHTGKYSKDLHERWGQNSSEDESGGMIFRMSIDENEERGTLEKNADLLKKCNIFSGKKRQKPKALNISKATGKVDTLSTISESPSSSKRMSQLSSVVTPISTGQEPTSAKSQGRFEGVLRSLLQNNKG